MLNRAWRVTSALVIIAALATMTPAFAQTAEEPKRRSITVVGIGRERAAPDTAQLQFAVENNAPSAKAAAEAAAAGAAKVIDALKKGVGPGGRVETIGYVLNPVYRPPPPNPDPRGRTAPQGPEIIGYTAAHTISVETHQIDQVGGLIDAAITAGSSRIDSLAFTIENIGPVQARALQAAAADAAGQATAIASALQVTLKGILEAATEGVARPLPQRYGGMAMRAEAMQMDTPIAAGEVMTEARLRVTYAIE